MPYLVCRYRAASDIADALIVPVASDGLPCVGKASPSRLLMACLSLGISRSRC